MGTSVVQAMIDEYERLNPVDIDDRIALLEATVRKLHAERKTLHEMLSEAGIPSDVFGDGVRTCLIGRVGVALDRLNRHDHRPLHRCPAQGCWRS